MIKTIPLFVIISSLGFYTTTLAQNVAINTSGAAPAASAMLDISSTNSGLLIPRMTSAQRTAIATPATGLKVYDTSTNTFWWFDGTVWVEQLGSGNGWMTTGNAITTTGIFGSTSNQSIRILSNNTERMRLLNTGELVINSITPFSGDLLSAYSTGTQFPINAYVSGTGSVSAGTFSNTSTATNGVGVLGSIVGGSGIAAVRGNAGTTSGSGVLGVGQSSVGFGLRGVNLNASGTAMILAGNNLGASYLINGSGAASTGSTTGIWGRTTAGTGVGGIFSGNAQGATSPASGAGVSGVGTLIGVAGYGLSTAAGTLKSGGYFEGGNGASFAYVGAVTVAGVNRKIEGNGTVNTTVKDLNGNLVVMSCPESPENLFQDFGRGQLTNGRCHISLDPVFAKNIIVNDEHPLYVHIQLKGNCNGVYVSNENGNGFDVIELNAGVSNVKFTYFVSANRADEIQPDGSISRYSSERFAPAIGRAKSVTHQVAELSDKEILNQDLKTIQKK